MDLTLQQEKTKNWAKGENIDFPVNFPDNLDWQKPINQFNFAIAIADFISEYMTRKNRCSGYTEKELIQQRLCQKKYRLKHKKV